MKSWEKVLMVLSLLFLPLVAIIWGIVYLASSTSSKEQKTWGKWILGISVVVLLINVLFWSAILGLGAAASVDGAASETSASAEEVDGAASETSTTSAEEVDEVELPTISAVQLCDEFKANEIAGIKKYQGRRYLITGTVDNITHILGTSSVHLKGGEAFWDVSCRFPSSEDDAIAQLSTGQQVTIEGEIDEVAFMNVEVDDCRLVE